MGTSVAKQGYVHSNGENSKNEREPSPLGQFLTDKGYISDEQRKEAEQLLTVAGGFLTRILVDRGLISEPKLLMALVKQCKVPHARLKEYAIPDAVIEMIPENVCLRHGLLPVDYDNGELTVAMLNPMDRNALEMLRRVCPGIEVQPILCSWGDFERAARRLFPDNAVFANTESGFDSLQLHLRGPWRNESAAQDQGEIPVSMLAADPAAAYIDQLKRQIRKAVAEQLHDLPNFVSALWSDAHTPAGLSKADLAEASQEALATAMEENIERLQDAIRILATGAPPATPTPPQISMALKSAYDSISNGPPAAPTDR